MKLRDYQSRAVSEVRTVILEGHKKVVMVLPTGAGKSVIFSEIIRLAVEKGKSVLWLVHRRNLVFQMQETLKKFGTESGVIMAGIESDTGLKVQLGTCQTYGRRLKLSELEQNRFFIQADLLLIDEAHRSISKTYMEIIDLYRDRIIIGCTATPMRADQRGLGEVYGKIVDVVGVKELTGNGFLSPARYFVPAEPDLEKIKMVQGDYELKELDRRFNNKKLIGDILENWLKLAEGRKTIIFCINVKHSRSVSEAFSSQGIPAHHLDAKSSDAEREGAFSMMEKGQIQIICNVALYQEGMDCPDISCVVMARPTKSLGLYRQCCGRGLRPSPGKVDTLIIDHAGVVEEHGLLDDEVMWTLDGKERAWKKVDRKEKEKKLVKCSVCSLVFAAAKVCPDCGSPVKSLGKKIETEEGELEELNPKKATVADKRRYLGMLKWWVSEKGYNHKMVNAKYHTRYGCWPHHSIKDCLPIKPDQAFLNLMKHEMIKYAKGKERGLRENQARCGGEVAGNLPGFGDSDKGRWTA